MVRTFVRLPRLVLIGLVRAYRLILSPYLPSACRYTPTCSAYAIQALRKYGVVKGMILSVYRIARCNPWGGHGYDPPRWFGEPRPAKASPPTYETAHAHELRNT